MPKKIDEHPLIERRVLIDQNAHRLARFESLQNPSGRVFFFDDVIARQPRYRSTSASIRGLSRRRTTMFIGAVIQAWRKRSIPSCPDEPSPPELPGPSPERFESSPGRHNESGWKCFRASIAADARRRQQTRDGEEHSVGNPVRVRQSNHRQIFYGNAAEPRDQNIDESCDDH